MFKDVLTPIAVALIGLLGLVWQSWSGSPRSIRRLKKMIEILHELPVDSASRKPLEAYIDIQVQRIANKKQRDWLMLGIGFSFLTFGSISLAGAAIFDGEMWSLAWSPGSIMTFFGIMALANR